jgi:HK97 family phage prohead protease
MIKRETRAASGSVAADATRKMVGYAARFDTKADIMGLFQERIAPGAFTRAIGNDDVRALVNHDPSLLLGRNKSGTLALTQDNAGLRFEITPPDTQLARDLMVSMERGDINQCSFGFIATREEWDETGDVPVRTLLEVELFDVSIVTYPAYDETSAAVRSLESWRSRSMTLPGVEQMAARMRMNIAQRQRGIIVPR